MSILEALGNKRSMFKNAGDFSWDVLLAKLWKCSKDQESLQMRLAFREMKTGDGA